MEELINNIMDHWMLWSIISLIILIIMIRLITIFLFKAINDTKKYHLVRRTVFYVGGIAYIIVVLLLWNGNMSELITYLGFLSAGIAIALKAVFANIAGWIFIILRKPFDIGHRIKIKNEKGDVIDIRMFQFSLVEVAHTKEGGQSTGKIIDVPNHYIFTHTFTNYTKGFKYIWEELSFLITFDSDWELAKEKLLNITQKHTEHFSKDAEKEFQQAVKKYMIHYGVLTPIVYTSVVENGVQLTARYLCPVKKFRNINGLIWEDILQLIKENDEISLAYPTYTIHSKA